MLFNRINKITLSVILILVFSGFSYIRIDYSDARLKNVCKELKGDVLIYLIFVDSRETMPWTEFDIQSTLDSVLIAVDWIESHARQNSISLNIKTDYYIGEKYSTINKRLPASSVYKSVTEPNLTEGLANLNTWADRIARMAGASFPADEKDGIPEISQPRNKERLIAYLRDRHMSESVALLYILNNYYKDDISIAINTMTDDDVEFAVVSYKNPVEITKSILSLFGGVDLNYSIFRRSKKQVEYATEVFPNDIMGNVQGKKLHDVKFGKFTKYMIGWTKNLETKHKILLNSGSFIDF